MDQEEESDRTIPYIMRTTENLVESLTEEEDASVITSDKEDKEETELDKEEESDWSMYIPCISSTTVSSTNWIITYITATVIASTNNNPNTVIESSTTTTEEEEE